MSLHSQSSVPPPNVPASQSHVLRHWDALNDAQRRQLAGQLASIDFGLLDQLYRGDSAEHDWHDLASRALPPEAFRLGQTSDSITPGAAKSRGEEALQAGRVGAILVAGGQGTRLGFPHPKGMFELGPVSARNLFQMHVEQLLAVGRRYGVRLPLYLMTSPATHEETVAHFAAQQRYGLAEEDLRIFCQGTMPAVDLATGQLLLAQQDSLALSPDGHGGTLAALVANGCLDHAAARGIEQLFYFQVDNPLTPICDPQFIGYHLASGSELSTQVIAKRDPHERVGNVARVDGQTIIIEYSDLPDPAAQRRNPDGSLALWAGNIAVHVFAREFLERQSHRSEALPFHRAEKKVAFVNEEGQVVEPAEPNAVKFERFIFDLLPHAEKAIVMEVDPAEAFAPVKNAAGAPTDTAEVAQQMIVDRHTNWLKKAGVSVAADVAVEISPLFALDPEELASKIQTGLQITEPKYFS